MICLYVKEDIEMAKKRNYFNRDEETEIAASEAAISAIGTLAANHKPDHLMPTLGVLFAQGLGLVSPEARDDSLDVFIWKLRKYCGIIVRREEEAA
jgi:hypothetical protein